MAISVEPTYPGGYWDCYGCSYTQFGGAMKWSIVTAISDTIT